MNTINPNIINWKDIDVDWWDGPMNNCGFRKGKWRATYRGKTFRFNAVIPSSANEERQTEMLKRAAVHSLIQQSVKQFVGESQKMDENKLLERAATIEENVRRKMAAVWDDCPEGSEVVYGENGWQYITSSEINGEIHEYERACCGGMYVYDRCRSFYEVCVESSEDPELQQYFQRRCQLVDP